LGKRANGITFGEKVNAGRRMNFNILKFPIEISALGSGKLEYQAFIAEGVE